MVRLLGYWNWNFVALRAVLFHGCFAADGKRITDNDELDFAALRAGLFDVPAARKEVSHGAHGVYQVVS